MTDTTLPRSNDEIVSDVASAFTELFGRTPDGVWSAPGRVNLIGEHTDYNEGFVFPFAIDRRTVLAFGTREDRFIRVSSSFTDEVVEINLDDLAVDELEPGLLSGWSAYPFGVVWALGQFGADLVSASGFDAYLESTVPVGAGLSSSAAIESSIALALNDSWGVGLDRQTLAKVGQLAENKAIGAPTGVPARSPRRRGLPRLPHAGVGGR
jgi:galactokinase